MRGRNENKNHLIEAFNWEQKNGMVDGDGWGFKRTTVDAVLNHPDLNFGTKELIPPAARSVSCWHLTAASPSGQLKEAASTEIHPPTSPHAMASWCKGPKALPSCLVQDFSEGPSQHQLPVGLTKAAFATRATKHSGVPRTERFQC